MKLSKFNLLKINSRLLKLFHWYRIKKLYQGRNPKYRDYLGHQLKRSLSKKNNIAGLRAELLVEHLVSSYDNSSDAKTLCIGPRNNYEIECLMKHGFTDVIGIDLFSINPQILIMDMHAMEFGDNTFDLIYASHSLEHAYDITKVVSEITRVARDNAVLAIEIPINYQRTSADLVDYNSAKGLLEYFEPNVGTVFYCEDLSADSQINPMNVEVARLVFSISKCNLRQL